ncbi:MFS transporter [Jeotgalibacillus marinus]|uniref:MFS transporter n=1 Tax=Jeotgalibacillus marinus TaxID=86667 RepID=A0ABV3Q741_9BACL
MVGAIKKNLVLFLLSKTVAVLGSNIYGFAISWYILAETGSALNFGVALLLSTLPRVLLSPIAGTLSDRWNRKRIIITSDFACAIWLAIVLLLFSFVNQEIWLLYLATVVLSILNTFYSSAVTSAIYNMVGPNYLQKAMSLNQGVVSLSGVLAPALAGIFFVIFPITTFMIINIIAFIISGIASILINYELFAEKKEKKQETSIFADLKFGLFYVKTQPLLLHLIVIFFFINFWFSVYPVTIPYLVTTIRGMEEFHLGFINSTFAAGMMLMAIIFSARAEVKRTELALFGGVGSLAIVLILIGLPSFPSMIQVSNMIILPYLMLMVLILSSSIMIINLPIQVLIQKSTPDDYRGRVMSLIETGTSAMVPLGYLIFGVLLEIIPAWILLGICGVSIISFIVYHIRNKVVIQLLREADQTKNRVLEGESVVNKSEVL